MSCVCCLFREYTYKSGVSSLPQIWSSTMIRLKIILCFVGNQSIMLDGKLAGSKVAGMSTTYGFGLLSIPL
jgi:hypothetical protein